jgi:DNA-binding GntR family transcriptional regulator
MTSIAHAPIASLTRLEAAPDLVERVYSALLNAISAGDLAPGSRITQEEIAEQLNVSRQPVLQALRQLKLDGFVQDAPGRGVLVSPLDAQWFEHVYSVRSALDALATQLAADRVAQELAQKKPPSFEFDKTLFAKAHVALKIHEVRVLIDLDIEFHSSIYKASNNPLIEQSARRHWQHIKRAMGAVLQSDSRRETVWLEHEAISLAIAAGDSKNAEKLMRSHGSKAGKSLVAEIASLGTSFPTSN